MRLIRLAPATPQQIRDLVLDDLSSVLQGARHIARDVPVPGRGVIDRIVAEPAGRLTIVCFHADAGAGELSQAIARWDWAAESLPALRALGGLPADVDLTRDPRLIMVAATVSDAARRLAGRVARPPVEILIASLVQSDETTALLMERASLIAAPDAAPASIDPELGMLPVGPERSLLRRMVEQLRDETAFSFFAGGVDVSRAGDRLASLVCATSGLEARFADGRVERIASDDDARRVAESLTRPIPSRAPSPAAVRPVAEPLTSEELRELERGLGSASTTPAASISMTGPAPFSPAEN